MEIPVAIVKTGHEVNGLDIIFFGKKYSIDSAATALFGTVPASS
jgi:hypothetical protein